MENEDMYIYDSIKKYANKAMKGENPGDLPVSVQLEKLKPKMIELSKELNTSVEDIFMRYMDQTSKVTAEKGKKLNADTGNAYTYGDPLFVRPGQQ